MSSSRRVISSFLTCAAIAALPMPGRAQTTPAAPAGSSVATPAAPAPAASAVTPEASGITPPPGYLIGPDDILAIVFWREKDLSAEVAVRPDGKISLPLLNDVVAAGLTPEELRMKIAEGAAKFVEAPNVTVNVKAINSRKVFITGMVSKPGQYPLSGPTTVVQLISIAGGLQEFADGENVIVVRGPLPRPAKEPASIKVNYKDISRGKKLEQNIELRPGDTVVVP